MDTLVAFLACIFLVLFLIFGLSSNSSFGYSKDDTGFNVLKWGIRVIFVIFVGVALYMTITKNNKHKEFNDCAKICGLGLYDSPDRVSIVLDSLCEHNRVKYGEIITDESVLRSIYQDKKRPNHYIVGCQDTLSGDRLEIQFIITTQDYYDGESWMPNYYANIRQITLKNEKGINKSEVAIDTAYLHGDSDFNEGHCAMLSDKCAILYTKQ